MNFSVADQERIKHHVNVQLSRLLRIFAVPLLLLNIVFATVGPFLYPQVFNLAGKVTTTTSHWVLCAVMCILVFKINQYRVSRKSDVRLVRLLFLFMVANSIVYGNSAFHIFDPGQADQVLPFISGIIIICIISGFGLAFVKWLPVAAIGPALSFVIIRILLEPGTTSSTFAFFLSFFALVMVFLTDVAHKLIVTYLTNEARQELLIERLNAKNEELKLARKMARQASASKSRFLATVGHDLRQPLQAAKLLIEGMKHEANAANANRALTALSALNQTSDDLITAGHVSDPERVSNPIPVSCNDVMIHAIESVMPTAQAFEREVDVAPTDRWVRTDPVLTARILQNLLSNALKYTRGRRILLGTRQRARRVRFEVWDQGPGVEAADRKRIFEEFVRLDYVDANHVGGLGLGLSLAKTLADDLGANLGIRSWRDRGSVFSIDAPLAAAPKGLGNRILLIVEDNPLDALAVESAARAYDWDCHIASGVDEASDLSLRLKGSINAIVSDYYLLNGHTGLDVWKRIAEPNGLPLIVVTGSNTAHIKQELRAHAVAIIKKPISSQRLNRALAGIGKLPSTAVCSD